MNSFSISDDEFGKPSKIFFLDTNLNSPVLITEIEETRNLIDHYINRHTTQENAPLSRGKLLEIKYFSKVVKEMKIDTNDLSQSRFLTPEMYPDVLKSMKVGLNPKNVDYDLASQVATQLENAICSGLESRGLPIDEVKGTASALGLNHNVEYRLIYSRISDLFGKAESRVKNHEFNWTYASIGSIKVAFNSKSGIIIHNNQVCYSSLNQVLMLKDLIASRFMMLEHVTALGLSDTLVLSLNQLFNWQDDTLKIYGNYAYNLLKTTEPLFKTRLSHLDDNIFGIDTAYSRMVEKVRSKELSMISLSGESSDQTSKLTQLVESISDIRCLVELFGCMKSCGHPLIDPALGGLSAAQEARSPDKTSLIDAQRLRNTFCHTILVAYVKQKGVWPKLIHLKPNTKLRQMNDRQERQIGYASYDLEDWNHTEWTKILDFDYFPNFLELMDDKAISLYRRDKHLTWDKLGKPTSQRRLLLEVMQRSNINIKDIVDQVSRRDIPEDWKIVSLYPKEREFKIEPRMFSMLVLEMRCFFTCIEANLADKLFRYLPQQTMTKTKTQNQERFLAFTDPNKDSHNSTLFIEIDLTRWNLRWRELVIHMLGHDINQMFGMKGTFTVTHWFFKQCQIIVRVQNCRPPGVEQKIPPDSDLAWTNHLGGFEGLNQKLWTAATYAMVEMGLIPLIQDNTISSYELIGQGDNQVVRLSVPCSKSERSSVLPLVRDKVNQALEKACRSVNQIVKPEENIESTSVLTYSKDVFVRGVEYSTSLKKHSRLFPVTSLDFPSVTANVRSILAGAVAGGENSLHPLRSAIIGVYHSARYLSAASRGMCIHGQSFPKLTMNHIISALLIPSSLGGLCGLNLASFFYKGGSDPLGKEISGLKLLASGNNFASQICSRALRALEEKYGIAETFDLKSLIDNPYSIPLSRKISPLSQVGDLTLDAFKYNVRNEDISPLIQSEIKESEITLKEDLISIRPLNPLLAHDLFESSGFGTIKLMRKMFVHTRTVQSVAQWVNPNITHTFLRSDLNEVLVFLKWLKGIPNTPYSGKSSYQLTKLFRSYWGLELHGVCSHQPLDFMHNKSSNRSLSSIKWSAHSATNLLHTRGPLTGYLGTTTREKRSEHGFKLVDTGAPSRSIMKLQLIKSQAYGNKQFNDLLQNISYTRSCVSLNSLTDLLPKVIGGSISHRYSSVMRQMSASYVGPLNFVTHIRIDTDNLGEVSGSVFNYPIMIQEFIVVAQYGAKLLHLHEQVQHGELIFDPVNLETLPDDSLVCNDTKFTHSKLPKTPLLFSEELYVMRTYDSVANEIPPSAIVRPVDYETIQCIYDAVFGFFVSTLRDQNRAKQLADTRGYANIPAKYQIDVPEAHAIGGKVILQQAAQAIVYTTFRDTFRTVQLHPQRWDEALFMSHSIDACIKSVIRYWLHPLFKSHRDYRSFEGATLRYGLTGSLLSRLAAYVRRQIYIITHDVSDNFWTRPIPTFAGENKTQFSECLMTLGARAVLRYKITDHPYYTGLANDFVSYMMLPKSMSLESGEVLDLIRCRYTIFAETIRKRSDEMLALEMLKIKDFKLTRVYADDIVTVMRNARSKTPLLRKKISPSLRKALSDKVMVGDHCKYCLPEANEYVDKQWVRYCQRKNGGVVSSGYTWLVLAPLMSITSNVAIVGNGNGGLADLLITLFNVDVLGLDLCSDMPKDQTTLMDYSPLGIQDENLTKFLQSDLSMVTSGDWFESSVRNRFYMEFNGLTTLFIDIVNADPTLLSRTILESLDQGNVSSVYCRIAGKQSDILGFGEMFYPLLLVKMWVLSRGEDDLECIFFLTRSKIPTHICSSALPLCSINVPEEYHSLIPRKYGLLLEAATCNSISWDKNTLDESKEQMENLCKSLLNKPESIRLKYHDRMNLILGYSTIVAAVEPDPLLVIKVWKQTGSIQTNLFNYKAKHSDINHIVKYAARLSNSIFDSYYFIS